MRCFVCAFFLCAVSGCASWLSAAGPALTALEIACQSGLLRQPAVQAQAQKLGVPPDVVAHYLCAIPDVAAAFEQRDADASIRAVEVAQSIGALP